MDDLVYTHTYRPRVVNVSYHRLLLPCTQQKRLLIFKRGSNTKIQIMNFTIIRVGVVDQPV